MEHAGGQYAGKDGVLYHVLHASEGEIKGVPAGKYLVDENGRIAYFVDPAINGKLTERDDGIEVPGKFDAPKTRLMAVIIDGILNGKLPWELVLIGALIAIVLELAGVPSLPFAVGVYLPISTSVPIFMGGMVRLVVDKIKRQAKTKPKPAPACCLSLGLHRRRLDRRSVDRVLLFCARQNSTTGYASADEGMWLFNNPPRKQLKEKYGFEPTDAWLEHVQKSSVRFNSGGSGSFVSADGLVMTNHHVGADALQKLSTKGKDYVKDGFHAKTRDRRNQVRRPGAERADEHRGRDRAGERRGQAGHGPRRGPVGPPGGHEHDRKGIARQDRPAQRRGHALPGRPVSSVPLQEIHRRAAGVRAGAGDRLFRRRPGQLRVSALRPRHLLLPRLRERQAGQDRALSEVEQGRGRRTTSWSSWPAIRAAPTG